jgi:transcriptional regulator with XRE-family HTH domain
MPSFSGSPSTGARRSFGERVRDFRHSLGVSQEELADRAGLDRTYVSAVERGRRNISLDNICRLAVALEVDAGELLRGLTVPPKTSV